MSLQWTAVATFLYAEVFLVLLLCIPFISPKRWNKIFKSRLMQTIALYGNTSFMVAIAILVFLLIDAFREVRKYGVPEKVDLANNPTAIEHIHMKLFRAQRNQYIAGFALLLCLLLRRLATLLSQQASLMASNEAFKKQAEGASSAAKKYMEENEVLQEVMDTHTLMCIPPEGEAGTEVPVKVLNCDTVTQVKDKLLDAVYKGIPFSQRPQADDMDLGKMDSDYTRRPSGFIVELWL
ncbi:B-cell receptor-associated protein 31-like [Sphaeramia orbicularis]|uniref:B-cell receptor-associated protein 31-like n=1 Tax=Sphaeramia orbicularis TaxID=375764 RepID=UPI00117C516A|nr:B-cell receptor-associated protein 31-like [Sphaeramia orbicularis]